MFSDRKQSSSSRSKRHSGDGGSKDAEKTGSDEKGERKSVEVFIYNIRHNNFFLPVADLQTTIAPCQGKYGTHIRL